MSDLQQISLNSHHVTGGYFHYINLTNWEKGILNPQWQDLKPEIMVLLFYKSDAQLIGLPACATAKMQCKAGKV